MGIVGDVQLLFRLEILIGKVFVINSTNVNNHSDIYFERSKTFSLHYAVSTYYVSAHNLGETMCKTCKVFKFSTNRSMVRS